MARKSESTPWSKDIEKDRKDKYTEKRKRKGRRGREEEEGTVGAAKYEFARELDERKGGDEKKSYKNMNRRGGEEVKEGEGGKDFTTKMVSEISICV